MRLADGTVAIPPILIGTHASLIRGTGDPALAAATTEPNPFVLGANDGLGELTFPYAVLLGGACDAGCFVPHVARLWSASVHCVQFNDRSSLDGIPPSMGLVSGTLVSFFA